MSDDMIRLRAMQLGLFETPVTHGQLIDCDALNADLLRAIRQRRAADAGVTRSNVGGWHSTTDMLDWGGRSAQRLAEAAVRIAKRMSHFEDRDAASLDWSVRMWANVSPPGALNISHAHPGVLWAAVYYVDMGDDGANSAGASGALYLEDPRFPVPMMTFPGFRAVGLDQQPQAPERNFPTVAGDIMVFPGFLRHGVRPHRGGGDRLSIAMNIYVKEAP